MHKAQSTQQGAHRQALKRAGVSERLHGRSQRARAVDGNERLLTVVLVDGDQPVRAVVEWECRPENVERLRDLWHVAGDNNDRVGGVDLGGRTVNRRVEGVQASGDRSRGARKGRFLACDKDGIRELDGGRDNAHHHDPAERENRANRALEEGFALVDQRGLGRSPKAGRPTSR